MGLPPRLRPRPLLVLQERLPRRDALPVLLLHGLLGDLALLGLLHRALQLLPLPHDLLHLHLRPRRRRRLRPPLPAALRLGPRQPGPQRADRAAVDLHGARARGDHLPRAVLRPPIGHGRARGPRVVPGLRRRRLVRLHRLHEPQGALRDALLHAAALGRGPYGGRARRAAVDVVRRGIQRRLLLHRSARRRHRRRRHLVHLPDAPLLERRPDRAAAALDVDHHLPRHHRLRGSRPRAIRHHALVLPRPDRGLGRAVPAWHWRAPRQTQGRPRDEVSVSRRRGRRGQGLRLERDRVGALLGRRRAHARRAAIARRPRRGDGLVVNRAAEATPRAHRRRRRDTGAREEQYCAARRLTRPYSPPDSCLSPGLVRFSC
mmetsp:Transcript_26195/g.104804  ORF Transcript_26195/g.104804 Transcript_26195/m.104804 type:complete len:375 (-) Transcript_26195:705-1829(-)